MKGADSTMTKQLTTINPATEEVINTYDLATKEKLKEKTKKAQNEHREPPRGSPNALTDELPDNIHEVQHRARDIMFSDKTQHNIQMAKAMTYQLRFIDEQLKIDLI